MAYLGRAVDSGAISNIENLDNITFDGSSSYSLTKNSVAFVPASASNLLISIDGVVNATNFTVSGSTIDFGVAVSSSSVCNFIIHLGVGIVTTPSDGSVTTAKIQDDAVTKDKLLSHNYPAFEAYLSADQAITDASATKVEFNTERFDTDAMYDNSTNYRFTPTLSGKYFVYAYCRLFQTSSSIDVKNCQTRIYKNGAEYADSYFDNDTVKLRYATPYVSSIIDFNGSTDYVEVYARVDTLGGGNGKIQGHASRNRSAFGAYRIGD